MSSRVSARVCWKTKKKEKTKILEDWRKKVKRKKAEASTGRNTVTYSSSKDLPAREKRRHEREREEGTPTHTAGNPPRGRARHDSAEGIESRLASPAQAGRGELPCPPRREPERCRRLHREARRQSPAPAAAMRWSGWLLPPRGWRGSLPIPTFVLETAAGTATNHKGQGGRAWGRRRPVIQPRAFAPLPTRIARRTSLV